MRDRRAAAPLVVVTDAAALFVAPLLAHLIVPPAGSGWDQRTALEVCAFVTASGMVILGLRHAYAAANLEGARPALIAESCVIGFAAVSVVALLSRLPVSTSFAVITWSCAALLLILDRVVLGMVMSRMLGTGRHRRALVVGADSNARALARQLGTQQVLRVVGFLDDYHPRGAQLLPGATVVGRPRDLQSIARSQRIDDVVVMPQALSWESLNHVLGVATREGNTMRVHIGAGFYELVATGVRLSTQFGAPVLTISVPRLSASQATLKLMLDCATAVGLLMLFSPVLCFMVCWQRFHRRRDLIARQPTIGRRGCRFTLLALCSSAPFDSSFLRKLPGLVNVLRGELAIVGPRPVAADAQTESVVLPADLRPGLTGPWRESEDPEEQRLLDLCYVRSYGVALDLRVLATRLRSHLPHLARRRPVPMATEIAR